MVQVLDDREIKSVMKYKLGGKQIQIQIDYKQIMKLVSVCTCCDVLLRKIVQQKYTDKNFYIPRYWEHHELI